VNKRPTFLSLLGPILVIGALIAFVVYSLFLYPDDQHVACGKNVVEQQIDIAVHVVRQWAGREGQLYMSCLES